MVKEIRRLHFSIYFLVGFVDEASEFAIKVLNLVFHLTTVVGTET